MKRTHSQIRKALLEVLKDGRPYAYGHLERRVNTNWTSVRTHCNDLFLFGMVDILENNQVLITEKGKQFCKIITI